MRFKAFQGVSGGFSRIQGVSNKFRSILWRFEKAFNEVSGIFQLVFEVYQRPRSFQMFQ